MKTEKLVAKLAVIIIPIAFEAVPVAIKAYQNRARTAKMHRSKLPAIDNSHVTVITLPR